MSNATHRAPFWIVVGAFGTLFLTGCTGASPLSPTSSGVVPSVGGTLQPTQQARTIDATAAVKKEEFRFVECHLPDGSFTQIPVNFYGMPGAVHECLKELGGKSDGIIKAPPPPPLD